MSISTSRILGYIGEAAFGITNVHHVGASKTETEDGGIAGTANDTVQLQHDVSMWS